MEAIKLENGFLKYTIEKNEIMKTKKIYDESSRKIMAIKDDYEVIIGEDEDGEYYGIGHKETGEIVWGYDSAFEDDYDKDLVESIYDQWDGTLTDVNRNGKYEIEL